MAAQLGSSRRKAMTTSKIETRFQTQIRSFNKLYKLDCNDAPCLPHGYQAAAKRIEDFMDILHEEVNEGNAIIDKLRVVGPLPEVLADIADWLGDIQVYCASEMRKFGLDNDHTLSTIMLSSRPKKNQINFIQIPPKSPVCSGRMDSVTNSSEERSDSSRVAAISPLYGLSVAVWNINGYQPRPPTLM